MTPLESSFPRVSETVRTEVRTAQLPATVLMALHLFQNAPNKQCEVSGFTMATCAVHLPRHSGFASLI